MEISAAKEIYAEKYRN